jgi:hypothetical protein
LVAVKFEARLEDGTIVSKSVGVEFTVRDGTKLGIFEHLHCNSILHRLDSHAGMLFFFQGISALPYPKLSRP